MTEPLSNYHFRDRAELEVFELLRTPVWVFDITDHAMWWGNRAALDFWQADSLADLLERDYSTDSDMVRVRLRQVVDSTPPGPACDRGLDSLSPWQSRGRHARHEPDPY